MTFSFFQYMMKELVTFFFGILVNLGTENYDMILPNMFNLIQQRIILFLSL